jgi:hypothetical protein
VGVIIQGEHDLCFLEKVRLRVSNPVAFVVVDVEYLHRHVILMTNQEEHVKHGEAHIRRVI